ncbi:MAG: phenylacetate--CoA ligase family protein [Nitrospirae bacterium]|nr:phenylacetate--CoA ligase family protein [Nitrospirota bacterium]
MNKFKAELFEKILFPLYHIKNGATFGIETIKTLRHLCNSQWWPKDKLEEYQAEKLKKLIAHAYHNVPYYRDLMNSISIKPGDISNVNDLRYFPILTKKDIKDNFDRIISKDIKDRKAMRASTGGTTGEPLSFYRDLNTRIWTEGALLRGWSWAKYTIGDSIVSFTMDDRPGLLGSLRARLINRRYYPTLIKTSALLSSLERVNEQLPHYLSGMTSNLFRIAVLCEKNNLSIHIPVIFSTAEMMHDYQREFLQKYFNGKVYDFYGCNEIGSLAYECEYGMKHIADEHVVIEAVGNGGRQRYEQAAEILITDLDNYVMPFIRYKNGDMGTLTQKKCECGRGLSVLKNVDGRSQEFLKTTDGRYVPGVFFPARFRNLKGIEQYQIVQEQVSHITLKIVKNQFFINEELEDMISVIKDKIGRDISVTTEECSNIALTGRGKSRLVISYIEKEF